MSAEETGVRWGLIGCGDIAAKRVAPALRGTPGSALVAVARARAELAADFARQHGARRWYADWREVLDDREIDAVYLATPVRLHAEQAVAAAEAGKHVLCEKPMALDVESCQRMVSAARSHGVRLGVAYYRHHYPVVARLRELLASGEIGRPVLAQVQAFELFDPPPGHPRAWLLDKASRGRRAHDGLRLPPHRGAAGPAGAGRRRCAASPPTFASATARSRTPAWRTCASRAGRSAVLAVSHAAQESRDAVQLFGTAGSAHVDVLNQGGLRVVTPDGVREERHRASRQPPPAARRGLRARRAGRPRAHGDGRDRRRGQPRARARSIATDGLARVRGGRQ